MSKRKAPAMSLNLAETRPAKRKTRSTGEAEIYIPLFKDRQAKEDAAELERVSSISIGDGLRGSKAGRVSRLKQLREIAGSSVTTTTTSPELDMDDASSEHRDSDVESDELNISPSHHLVSPVHAISNTPLRLSATREPRRTPTTNSHQTPSRKATGSRKSHNLAVSVELPPSAASSRLGVPSPTTSFAEDSDKLRTPTKRDRSTPKVTGKGRSKNASSVDNEEALRSPSKQINKPKGQKPGRAESPKHNDRHAEKNLHAGDSHSTSGPSQPTPTVSPSKNRISTTQTSTSTSLPQLLPPVLHEILNIQKGAIRRALLEPPVLSLPLESLPSPSKGKGKGKEVTKDKTTPQAVDTLTALLKGTTERGEGNSCIVMGPRGSGKSRVVSQALAAVINANPIVVRLSGEAQLNDKLAMREMARQLVKQTGENFVFPEDENEGGGGHAEAEGAISANMVPAAHLPTLISTLKTLPRPTIVILESFDLFTAHARQALLYCLLDTVQSCRPGAWDRTETSSAGTPNLGAGGVAVIGVTSRVDCLNLLEKRVKSRFSGRLIRVGVIETWETYLGITRSILNPDIQNSIRPDDGPAAERFQEWSRLWSVNVENFLANRDATKVLKDVFSLNTDVRTLCKILTPVILEMKPSSPWLRPANLRDGVDEQIAPPRFGYLKDLPYPSLALLIATYHVSNTGHDVFNFEMLWNRFSKQVDRTSSMPVMVGGASVGMIRLKRNVILGAFDELIALKVFLPVGASNASGAKQFMKYRCAAERFEISEAVEKSGNLRLKTWLKRPAE